MVFDEVISGGIMSEVEVESVGASCGQHSSYTFYKAFSYCVPECASASHTARGGGVHRRVLALGEFFLVRLSWPRHQWPRQRRHQEQHSHAQQGVLCVCELQLIFTDNSASAVAAVADGGRKDSSPALMACVRLYFRPEDTPEGRLAHHGRDEVLSVQDKLTLRVDDLVSLLARHPTSSSTSTTLPTNCNTVPSTCASPRSPHSSTSSPSPTSSPRSPDRDEVKRRDVGGGSGGGWTCGSAIGSAHYSSTPSTSARSSLPDKIAGCDTNDAVTSNFCAGYGNNRLDLRDVAATKRAFNDCIERDDLCVVVLNYDQYCRTRGLLKRLEGVSCEVYRHQLVRCLGGFHVPSRRTLMVYCRDVFDHPLLESLDIICQHLTPKLRGRTRKDARKMGDTHISDSDNENDTVLPAKMPMLFGGCGRRRSGNKPHHIVPGLTPHLTSTSSSAGGVSRAKHRTSTSHPLTPPHPLTSNGVCLSRLTSLFQSSASSAVVAPHGGTLAQQQLRSTTWDDHQLARHLYGFMKDRGTPITKKPTVADVSLDVCCLYRCVQQLGGYTAVCVRRLWPAVFESVSGGRRTVRSSTSVSLRRIYERFCLPYEHVERQILLASLTASQQKQQPSPSVNPTSVNSTCVDSTALTITQLPRAKQPRLIKPRSSSSTASACPSQQQEAAASAAAWPSNGAGSAGGGGGGACASALRMLARARPAITITALPQQQQQQQRQRRRPSSVSNTGLDVTPPPPAAAVLHQNHHHTQSARKSDAVMADYTALQRLASVARQQQQQQRLALMAAAAAASSAARNGAGEAVEVVDLTCDSSRPDNSSSARGNRSSHASLASSSSAVPFTKLSSRTSLIQPTRIGSITITPVDKSSSSSSVEAPNMTAPLMHPSLAAAAAGASTFDHLLAAGATGGAAQQAVVLQQLLARQRLAVAAAAAAAGAGMSGGSTSGLTAEQLQASSEMYQRLLAAGLYRAA